MLFERKVSHHLIINAKTTTIYQFSVGSRAVVVLCYSMNKNCLYLLRRGEKKRVSLDWILLHISEPWMIVCNSVEDF